MAPLQHRDSLCCPSETGIATGPRGSQYFDNDGTVRSDRVGERLGYQSFTHGVTIFSGGIPHDVRPPKDVVNHGTVLYVYPQLKPDLSRELRIKPGTLDERVGMHAYERNPHRSHDRPIESELNHGTVLHVYPQLKPNTSWEGKTNVAGGRPTERWGARGGFHVGQRIWAAGGCPRDVPVEREITNRGTVLFTTDELHADRSHDGMVKPGTTDERYARIGSFEHGDAHLRYQSAADALKWREAGQKSSSIRRCAPGHYNAGVTILGGGMPAYAM